jgi:hypothetical protein
MMFFNNRTFREPSTQAPLTCETHHAYSLDQICLSPKCRASGRLCVMCSYEGHRGHQIMPFQIFIEQAKEAWHKEKDDNEHILEDCLFSLNNLKKKINSVKKGIEEKINALFSEIEEEIERKQQLLLEFKKMDDFFSESLKMIEECGSNKQQKTFDCVPKIMEKLKIDNMEIVGVNKNNEKLKIIKESIENLENQFDKEIWVTVWRLEQEMAEFPTAKEYLEERKEADWKLRKSPQSMISAI